MKKNLLSLLVLSAMLSMFACKGNTSGQEGEDQSSDGEEGNKVEVVDVKKPKAPKNEGVVRVLFVGNSHTDYYVSLPLLLKSFCEENGKDVEIDELVTMGASIDEIMDDNKSKAEQLFSKADEDGNYYDYIILQEKTPVAITELDDYKANCKAVAEQVSANSPDVAIYIYELMSPLEHDDSDYKDYGDEALANATKVAKSLKNAGVLRIGSAVADAYNGKEGYKAVVEGKDLLRHGRNTLHILNDGGFLCGALIYRTIYNDSPKVPAQLPLATGTGDHDEIKMQDVSSTISNADALLKIAARY